MSDWLSYDEVAETYELIHAPRLAVPARDLITLAQLPEGGRLLDVGTGTGASILDASAAAGPEGIAVGVDLSVGMLVAGKRARPSAVLVAASAVDLPFRNATFDAVIANFVISHFRSYRTGLAEMIRVLRPGGRLAISSWSDERDDLQAAWNEMMLQVIPRDILEPVRKQAAPWQEKFRDRHFIEETLIDAELRHIRSEEREYRFTYSIEEFVTGLESWATGRFVRQMLGEARWAEFRQRVRATFAARFSDPLNDFRTVLLATGSKP